MLEGRRVSWNYKEEAEQIFNDLAKDLTAIQDRKIKNNRWIRNLKLMKYLSNFAASCGVSGGMGLALACAGALVSNPVIMPATIGVAVVTFMATGIGWTCHRGVQYLQRKGERIYNLAKIARETRKSMYEKYLLDGDISPQELNSMMADMETYLGKKRRLEMKTYHKEQGDPEITL